ncbi:MAG: hypothetical protein C5B47_03540 [Verrucomicrobia bacterium]|nr:MAG: hypothetical protein C5B47_03540 [Verrucomicrobiota bacterium]
MIDMRKPPQETLSFFLLHYRQTHFLNSLLTEAKNFDPNLVSFELHDDGSPAEFQKHIAAILDLYPGMKTVLHPSNHGTVALLEKCLAASQSDYTYFGASDDAGCPASIQRALWSRDLKNPLIVSDFYVIYMERRSSVYVEAILPPQWMTGKAVLPQELKKTLREGRDGAYIATHASLAPTKALLSAGGFPQKMKWHTDWFSVHVAALRTGIQYVPVPLACWRQSAAGYSHSSRSGAKRQRDVLREILSTLTKPEYSDVREIILSPNMTPLLDDIACQTLLAILSRPRYWRFLRRGHLRNALHEAAAPWISENRLGGKLLKWLDRHHRIKSLRFVRQKFIDLFLLLGGAQVGRNVRFGNKVTICGPRGLRIGDNVTFGDGVSIRASHPLAIGSGTQIGNNVRLESVNFSKKTEVRFLRKKSICIGENVLIGSNSIIGPGANIPSFTQVPPNSHVENVESSPLFFLDDTDQIRVNHEVLRERYGLDPQGIPIMHAKQREAL